MTDHDHGYKRLFSRPEMIRDLLLGFVREPWIADIDFATLEEYPGEFIDDRLQQRRNVATMRNLAAALFRLENSREPETVQDVLVAVSVWLRAPEQMELRHSLLLWLREGKKRKINPQHAP